jgi:hypothetical protein
MLSAADIVPILDARCEFDDQIKNWRRYNFNVDIKRASVPPLVIEPDLVQRLDGTPLAGIVVRDIYHNTNLGTGIANSALTMSPPATPAGIRQSILSWGLD